MMAVLNPRFPRTWPSPIPHESLDRYWLYKASQGETLQLKNLWKLLGVFLTNLTNKYYLLSRSTSFSHHLLTWKPSAHPVLSIPVFLNILFQVSDAFKKRVVVGRWDLD